MADTPLKNLDIGASPIISINNTAIRRFLTKLALQTTARLYHAEGFCSRITPNKIVKRGPYVRLTEAASMQYVAERTSVPVPKVHCAFVSNGRTYIVMERLRGEPISQTLTTMDEPGRDKLLVQLKGYLDDMRALSPPASTGVQSCICTSLYDSRIPKSDPQFGPFNTIQEFHLWLRDGLQISQIKDEEYRAEWEEMIIKQDGSWPPSVFTHGDLNPSNILVHKGQISGIIDWEFAGWYPHYWEYTSAWYGNRSRTTWSRLLDKILTPFPEELEMEITRQKWWGDF